MAKASPTARTLALLRQQGYEPWIVETWNRFSCTRHDLWNFGDVIAIKDDMAHLIVQTTSYSGVSARVKKILAEPRALTWLKTGGEIDVHGWRKVPHKPGSKRLVWRPRIVSITQEMFAHGSQEED